jgi:putative DNA methylase
MTDYNFKPKEGRSTFGWYGKNKLPHFDGEQVTQFVTFRLCDSMPQEVLERWRSEGISDAAFRRRVEGYLDAGYGACWLREPRIAQIVHDALVYNDQKRYDLIAWVIMPNHGHVLFRPLPGIHVPDAMHSIKSYTATQVNKVLGRTGRFWQSESFDRYIRNIRHRAAVIRYIENNPVKAGLCVRAEQWRWSSAYDGRIEE